MIETFMGIFSKYGIIIAAGLVGIGLLKKGAKLVLKVGLIVLAISVLSMLGGM